MTPEVLDKANWSELDHLPDDPIPHLDPSRTIAFVMRDEGEIIARLYLIQVPCLSGIWVREDRKGHNVAAALEKFASTTMRNSGKTHAFAIVREGAALEKYMTRRKFAPAPWRMWIKRLKG